MRRFVSLAISVFIATLLASAVPVAVYGVTYESYAALGDSVAAGDGLSSSGGSSEDELCDRSPQAYPYKVASSLGATLTHLACSGAKTDEGIYDEQERNGTEIIPQLDAAFANGRPDLITITVGANDARWSEFIWDCYNYTCGSRWDNRFAKVLRADLRIELWWTLFKINQYSDGNPPKVLLTGYYAPFANRECSETIYKGKEITADERAWLRTQTANLNQAIKSVTQWYSFAEYVPVSFAGHELCSADPWIQGQQAPQPFHPTAPGQQAIARAALDVLNR